VFREHHLFVRADISGQRPYRSGSRARCSEERSQEPGLDEGAAVLPDLTSSWTRSWTPPSPSGAGRDNLDQLEDDIIDKAAPGALDRIYHLKHS